MVSLFTTSLLLFISSVISAADNDTCGGCSIGAVSIATFWPELFEYLNETVYLFVDLNDNSTSTLSVEPATDARSSYTSICYSAYSSLISQYKDVSACISATSYVNVVYGTSFTETWPTTYLNVEYLVSKTSYLTTRSGTTTCVASSTAIELVTGYPVKADDKNWYKTFTNPANARPEYPITWLDKLPYSAFASLDGGNYSTCTPGDNGGVPTWKIPIVGTASTVYQYKSAANIATSKPVAPSTSKALEVGQPPRTSRLLDSGTAIPSKTPDIISLPPLPNGPMKSPPPSDGVLPPFITPASTVPRPNPPFTVLPSGAGIVLPNGNTLSAGNTVTISGTPFSLSSSAGNIVLVNSGKTVALSPPTQQLPAGYFPLPSGSGIVLGNGQTLRPGSATNVNGIPVSLAPAASFLVVSGTTLSLSAAPTLPVGYSVLPSGSGVVLPNGATLRPGVATTVDGVEVSLGASSSVIVFGGRTVAASSVTGTGSSSATGTGSVALGAGIRGYGDVNRKVSVARAGVIGLIILGFV